MVNIVPSQVPARQNEPLSLTRLAASSRLYTLAKRVQFTRLGFVALLAASSPFIFQWNEGLAEALAIVGAVTVVGEAASKAWEGHLVAQAARVQDCFDSYVFDLPWNEYLVGDEPRHELLNEAASKFKDNREHHANWYAVTEDVNRPYDVLIAQHENLLWDARLRKQFAIGALVAWSGWMLFEVIVGLVQDITLADFLLVFMVPALPALIAAIDLTFSNWRTAQIRDQLDQMWIRLWKRALIDPTKVNDSELRQLQDAIYACRVRTTQVPNWLHKLKRPKYEADAWAGLENFKKQMIAAGRLAAVVTADPPETDRVRQEGSERG